MDFQTYLDEMSSGVSGYTGVINALGKDVDDVLDTIETLGDQSWKGLSQQEFNNKVQIWAENCSLLINSIQCLSDAINNNLPKMQEKLTKGQGLDI